MNADDTLLAQMTDFLPSDHLPQPGPHTAHVERIPARQRSGEMVEIQLDALFE